MAGMNQAPKSPHLVLNTAEWHAFNVGMLVGNLQSLEFSARVALELITGAPPIENLLALEPGDWVPEAPMTNYDQLGDVLQQFNESASPQYQLDVARIVALRDQLAHGRTAANNPIFPLTLLKFGRPVKGRVPVSNSYPSTPSA